jgi:hypothetical protein
MFFFESAQIRNFALRFILFISFILAILSCKKEIVELPSPSIQILSTEIKALTTFEITVEINRGEGQVLNKAELILEDITISSMGKIVEPIQLTNEKVQQCKITVNTERLSHDFVAVAKLNTDKYTYSSENKTVRALKNNVRFDFVHVKDEALYADQTVGLSANPGYEFIVTVEFTTNFKPATIEVKLNGTIPITHTIAFKNISQGSEYFSTEGLLKLPNNLSPGIYDLSLVIDGINFKCNKKLQVLKGKWNLFDQTYSGEKRGDYAWFVLNDKLYLVGGEFYVTALQNSPVWSFDLITKTWTRLDDFPYGFSLEDNRDVQILPFQLKYADDGYILIHKFPVIELWRFNGTIKSWEKVSEYPGNGNKNMTCFIVGDQLFLGGGIDYAAFPVQYVSEAQDFWSYNFKTQKWEQKNNLPFVSSSPYRYSSCSFKNKAYVLEVSKDFWEYDPVLDAWQEKTKFPGQWRHASNLISDGQNIYLIGGEYRTVGVAWNLVPPLRDCWKYSPDANAWELKAFLPNYSSHGIAFLYNNKIINGLGYFIETNYDYFGSNQTLHEFTAD